MRLVLQGCHILSHLIAAGDGPGDGYAVDGRSVLQREASAHAVSNGEQSGDGLEGLLRAHLTVAVAEHAGQRHQNAGAAAYVSRLYTKMLGRAFDPDGLNAWCAAILEAPTTKTLLKVALNGFMHSQEFLNKNLNDMDFVKVLYPTFLGRESDPDGLQAWVQALQTGSTRDEVAAGFAYSIEFTNIMAQYGFK